MVETVELAVKNFKVSIINMSKDLKGNECKDINRKYK